MAAKKPPKTTTKTEPAVGRAASFHKITRIVNCIIGERGTGKTTVLELLRFAIKGSDGEPKRQKSLLKENLGSGLVRVAIETKEGRRLVVERQGGAAAAEVLTDGNAPAGFTLEHGLLFDCDIYGQDEIESIAGTPARQLELIDRFAQTEIGDLQAKIREATNALRGNAHEILTLEDRGETLDLGTAGLAELREKVSPLEAAGVGPNLDAFNREVGLKGLRDREARAVEQARRFVDGRREGLLRERAGLSQGVRVAPDEALAGPNAERMKALQAMVDATRADVDRGIVEALTALDSARGKLDALGNQLAQDHLTQDARYRDQVTKHEAERSRATERVELQRRVNAALDQERALKELDEQVAAMRCRRKELILELQRLRQERYAVRSREAAALTAECGTLPPARE